MDKEFIQLREFLYLLKKKWALIVFIIAICLISTIAITKYVIKPVYESKTKVLILKAPFQYNIYSFLSNHFLY